MTNTPSLAIPIWQVDAFAEQPFVGNPAAVCIVDRFPEDAWMQQVAAEMNLSETAFLVPGNASDEFQLRWFTPETEVDLCGHATLASAHVLFEQHRTDPAKPVNFQTKSGLLSCHRRGDQITLDFPSTPPDEPLDPQVAKGLLDALHVNAIHLARARFDAFVVLDDPKKVVALQPDFRRLSEIEARGVIVTARSDENDVDFISRFFAPRSGVNEDPVTGSAHCALAPYWAEQLGRDTLVGYQASRRGGTVRVRVAGDRVQLSGRAVTVLEGKLIQNQSNRTT